jgi:hypothetical protein
MQLLFALHYFASMRPARVAFFSKFDILAFENPSSLAGSLYAKGNLSRQLRSYHPLNALAFLMSCFFRPSHVLLHVVGVVLS